MSKFLITGATGFVGRAVCRTLRAEGQTLTGTTRDEILKQGPENVPLYHIPEINAETDWSRAVAGAEIIVHLAARAHVMGESAADPLTAFRGVNRDGTASLARAAAAAGARRFVFVSTVKVNGESTGSKPFDEDDPPSPEDAYGVSKWEAERELAAIANETKLEVVILRPPLVYGPHVKGNFLSLIRACEKGWPIPLAAVDNARSMIFVGNLASAISLAARHERAASKTYLVSDGEDVSTPELIARLSAALGRTAHLWRVPSWCLKLGGALTGKATAVHRLTDSLTVKNTKICAELGWAPRATLDDGLATTAAWRRGTADR